MCSMNNIELNSWIHVPILDDCPHAETLNQMCKSKTIPNALVLSHRMKNKISYWNVSTNIYELQTKKSNAFIMGCRLLKEHLFQTSLFLRYSHSKNNIRNVAQPLAQHLTMHLTTHVVFGTNF